MENKNEKSWAEREADAKKKVQAWEEKLKKAEAEFKKARAKEIEAFDRDYEASVKVEECLSQINEKLRNSSPIDISEYLDRLNKVKEEHDQAGKELLMAKKECEKANKKRIKAKKGLEEARDELWMNCYAVEAEPRTTEVVEESKTK